MLDGANADLAEVANQLKPGAVLYYESSRLRRRTFATAPERMRRILDSAGCHLQGTYIVRPSFAAAALYLPADAPHALAWYVKSNYPASTPRQRLLEGLLAAATGLRTERFAAVAPFVAIVATRDCIGRSPAVLRHPEITALLDGSHDEVVPIMLSYGDNRVVLLPIARQEREPRLILKVPRLATFNARNHNEQATLGELHARLQPSLRRAIPKPFGVTVLEGGSIIAESYMPGESVLRSSVRWGRPFRRKLDDLRSACDWLTTFHQQTTTCILTWDDCAYQQHIAPLVESYRQAFGTTQPMEERLFAGLRQRSDLLAGSQIPIVWQHRDFNIWNVVRDRRDIGIIDWEGGQLGLPLLDLLHFVTHWSAAVQGAVSGAERQRSFERLFLEHGRRSGRATRAAHHEINRYCDRLEIDIGFLPLLLVTTWLELALRREQQRDDLGEMSTAPRENNQYLRYVAALAEHATAFFDERALQQTA